MSGVLEVYIGVILQLIKAVGLSIVLVLLAGLALAVLEAVIGGDGG